MKSQQVCDEVRTILDDMESSMDKNKTKLSGGGSISQERSYRIGYYAAIRDARRLLDESHIIALFLNQGQSV